MHERAEIKCGIVDCKVLKGKSLEKGNPYPESGEVEFNAHNNPLFNEALELIDSYLIERRRFSRRGGIIEEIKFLFFKCTICCYGLQSIDLAVKI